MEKCVCVCVRLKYIFYNNSTKMKEEKIGERKNNIVQHVDNDIV